MIDFMFIIKSSASSISFFFIFLSSQAQENSSTSSTKKKNKFVSLYNKEGQDRLAVILPGRHSCECLAQKHKLINNCISCGRIVCEQEGSGPCLFCGSLVIKTLWVPRFLFFILPTPETTFCQCLTPFVFRPLIWVRKNNSDKEKTSFSIKVCSREEQEILERDSNKSQKLRKKLMGGET